MSSKSKVKGIHKSVWGKWGKKRRRSKILRKGIDFTTKTEEGKNKFGRDTPWAPKGKKEFERVKKLQGLLSTKRGSIGGGGGCMGLG